MITIYEYDSIKRLYECDECHLHTQQKFVGKINFKGTVITATKLCENCYNIYVVKCYRRYCQQNALSDECKKT